MKKFLVLIITAVTCLSFICSCNKKETNLIELTSEELINNIISEDEKNFVFAIWNSSRENGEEFMRSLKSVVSNANIDIYYIDYQNISMESASLLIAMFDYDISYNSYYVLKNGKYEIENEYSNFQTLYKNLKGHAYTDELEYISDDKKREYFEEAKKLYEEGQISLSKEKLSRAWTLPEAKEYNDNQKYYKILTAWEHYTFTDKDNEYVNFNSKFFVSNSNYFLDGNKEGKFEGFQKDLTMNEYKKVYYYIKDDIIYTSNSENSEYKKRYKINYLDNQFLRFTDLKDNKEYEYMGRWIE